MVLKVSGKLVLVTGGAGFIGSHTVDRLVSGGHRVIVLDNMSTGHVRNLADWHNDPRVRIVEADVREDLRGSLDALTNELGPIDRIIHLAAQTSVADSIEHPIEDVETNYVGTVRVLEYAKHTGVRKVVFSSSAAVYDNAATVPTSEDDRCRPISPYGVDKLASEYMLDFYRVVHGVESTVLRFFNVYGPRQDPTNPYSGVISIFAERAMANAPLTIFGDGAQTRDFVFVEDVSWAVVTACLTDVANGDVLNIGTNRRISVNDLASLLVKLAGSSSKIVHSAPRQGEITDSGACIERAQKALGYTPSISLRKGLAATLDWMGQEHGAPPTMTDMRFNPRRRSSVY